MRRRTEYLVSVVVPLFNEADYLPMFHKSLESELKKLGKDYQIIYVDDGSKDKTFSLLKDICDKNSKIKLVRFSRNFGKENALAAGITEATGQAIITMDGDGQHPMRLIPRFVKAWENGSKVVIGVREKGNKPGVLKQVGSSVFYKLFNRFTDKQIIPRSTDFRLIDHVVQQEFLKLTEADRLTRGLIDWLGFKRRLIYFQAGDRKSGEPGYSKRKLMQLATHGLVSFTPAPLYLFGYIGVFITLCSFVLGTTVLVEQVLLGDPWSWDFTGTAMLSILTLFLVGILLTAQGVLSLYITHIHSQTKNRPLYIIDYENSVGVKKN